MNKSKLVRLSQPVSGNSILMLFASIIFGSFAFATSNLDLPQPSTGYDFANITTSLVQPAQLPGPHSSQNMAVASNDQAVMPGNESAIIPAQKYSLTKPDSTAQKTMVLVLLSVLAGDRKI